MLNLEQAIAYGRQIGVKYYVYNDAGALMGGTTTLSAARKMKADFERKDRENPWTRGTTKFEIRSAENL